MRRFFVRSILLGIFVGGLIWVGLPWYRMFSAYQQLKNEALPSSVRVPVQGLERRQVNDTWGAARSQGRTHEGTDLFAKRGTPVLSATRGIVTRLTENNLGGTVLYVMGPGGYQHYYAHLERYAKFKAGDWVKAGDTLGFVGNSGNAAGTPPHLHYGLYTPDWQAVNPYPLLARAPIQQPTRAQEN